MNLAKVTVIIPTYNSAKYILPALGSVFSQSYKDFEVIVVDDASTDGTQELLASISDHRFTYILEKENRGPGYCRNIALEKGKGKYIILLDSDDLCVVDRFKILVDFMENHSNIAVCGSWYTNFGMSKTKHRYFLTPEMLKAVFLFDSAMCHSSCIIRKSSLDKGNYRYNAEFRKSQDYEMLNRMSKKEKFCNLPNFLYLRRIHKNQLGYKRSSYYSDKVRTFNSENIFLELKITEFSKEYRPNRILFDLEKKLFKKDLNEVKNWIDFLVKKNEVSAFYDQKSFKAVLLNRFWRICKQYGMFGSRSFFFCKFCQKIRKPFFLSFKSFLYGFLPLKKAKRKFLL